jgi:intein-encoded DNA endonuclease-like protein
LLKLGFSQNKTKRLLVPDMPKKYFFDFVRGYFDGDGNVWVGEVHKERKTRTLVIQIAFTSVSKDFLISLKNKLHEHGVIGGSIYSHKTKNYSRLAFVNSDALKISKMMYNTVTPLVLARKKEVFERFLKMKMRL